MVDRRFSVEFRQTRSGAHHVYYTGPRGQDLPLLDGHGNLVDLNAEVRGLPTGAVYDLVTRIAKACQPTV